MTIEERTLMETRFHVLCSALQMETAGSKDVPPADMMQRDIKRLDERLKMFPSDDYAECGREMREHLVQALKTYFKISIDGP